MIVTAALYMYRTGQKGGPFCYIVIIQRRLWRNRNCSYTPSILIPVPTLHLGHGTCTLALPVYMTLSNSVLQLNEHMHSAFSLDLVA